MPRWPRPLAVLVVVFALYELAYFAVYLVQRWAEPRSALFGDFFAFWSYARFVHTRPAVEIYNQAALAAFQQALPGGLAGFYPFPYPPIFLLYLWPLGWLGYLPAAGLWIAGTLAAYLVAVAGRDWRSPALWLAVVAPTTLFAIISGQNGLLAAALMIGGFRLMARWPLLGGALLGGLAFKPHLVVLVPVVLVAARRWRSLVGLAVAVVGLVAASAVAFGPTMWLRWLVAIPALGQAFEANRQTLNHLMPTVAAGLLDAGTGRSAAQAVQAVVAVGVAGALWLVFRHGQRVRSAPRALDVAALQVGVFLVTPYAFIYDMPMVTSAVASTLLCCTRAGRAWRAGEATTLIAALLLPLAMFSGALAGWPLAPLILTALLAVIVRAGWTM